VIPGLALQFSTGDFVPVRGHGLVGRAPQTEPGETADQLVPILDPARSISKTHLEFGIDGDAFWIADRFSANGTRIQENGVERRCVPGRRYRVAVGAVVHLGDQFFVVA
jgi:predicted component of type VI protein secretion system